MQKIAKNSPSGHHRTTLLGYIFATKAHKTIGKKLVKQQYLLHMSSQCGELAHWRLRSAGEFWHPIKFQPILCLGSVTAAMSLNGGQSNFAQCLAVSWAGTLYIHFQGLLPCNGMLQGA